MSKVTAFLNVLGAVLIALPLAALHVSLALLAHPFLRLFGRRGTVRLSETTLRICFDREAFRRAQ
jgi:hypothetical protein